MTLQELGLLSWFDDKIDKSLLDEYRLARVIIVNKESYIIKNERTETKAEITGRLMYNADSPLDFPTVGDWVYAQYFDNDTLAIIQDIVPRKSLLKRKTSGSTIEYQLLGANIDKALLMQSLDADFNLRRLERYLVMAKDSDIHPIVLLSKSDLLSESELEKKKSEIRSLMPDLEIVSFSNVDRSGLDKVNALLLPGETYCLLGSSGVGKTTLLNTLFGEERFETLTVREKDSKGRHATTRRQLNVMQNGALIIDTPGLRELGNIGVEAGIKKTFDDIMALSVGCRFKDCTHVHEEGCAVLSAVDEGKISRERYENYIKMTRESAYHEMSYLEKRKRDKEFGKMVKRVMKNHRKK